MSNVLCLIKGTKVTLENGTLKNIEEIQIGDTILSYNIERKLTEIVTVKNTARAITNKIIRLKLSNGLRIDCTVDHPIFVNTKGWCSVDTNQTIINHNVLLGQLEVEQECLTLIDNTLSFSKIISIDRLSGKYAMFNISGGKNHCYFANGILVHDENLK
jgi:hypothetical protein